MAQSIRNIGLLLLGMLGLQLGSVTAHANDAGVLCSSIVGESERPGSIGCIDVLAWSWGQSNAFTFDGLSPPGPPSLQDFSFTKFIDASSEDFFRMVVTGSFLKGTVEYRQYRDCGTACLAAEPYITIRFRDVLFTSQSVGGSSGDRPAENVSLVFGEVSYCYRPTIKDSLGTAQCFAFSRHLNAPIPPF